MADNSKVIEKPSIALIGTGRAGSALAYALHTAGYRISAIWNRTPAHAAGIAAHLKTPFVPLERVWREAPVTLIAVRDDSLTAIAQDLAQSDALHGHMFVHCSGALPAAALQPLAQAGALIGAFHPLLSIAEPTAAIPAGVAFAIEAAEPLHQILWQVAQDLHGRPFDIQPQERALYHAAAVIASNYMVIQAALATTLLERTGVAHGQGLAAILPLMHSTLANLQTVGLPAALTGPLVRGDLGTISHHLIALMQTAPEIASAYRALGYAALPLVEARGNLDSQTLRALAMLLEEHLPEGESSLPSIH